MARQQFSMFGWLLPPGHQRSPRTRLAINLRFSLANLTLLYVLLLNSAGGDLFLTDLGRRFDRSDGYTWVDRRATKLKRELAARVVRASAGSSSSSSPFSKFRRLQHVASRHSSCCPTSAVLPATPLPSAVERRGEHVMQVVYHTSEDKKLKVRLLKEWGTCTWLQTCCSAASAFAGGHSPVCGTNAHAVGN